MTSATVAATESALKLLPPFWANLLRDSGDAIKTSSRKVADQQRLLQLAREKLAQLFAHDEPGCC
jgi:hypothetical protein